VLFVDEEEDKEDMADFKFVDTNNKFDDMNDFPSILPKDQNSQKNQKVDDST